jgi:hypothetical protein
MMRARRWSGKLFAAKENPPQGRVFCEASVSLLLQEQKRSLPSQE